MIVSVDEDRCRGHGVCTSLCPSVFALNDDGYSEVLVPTVPADLEEDVRAAVRQCPEKAIFINEGEAAMQLTVGQTLVSTVDQTAVIVVRAPAAGAALTCGGAQMVDAKADRPTGQPDAAQQAGTALGKRYADESAGLEVLCTKAGTGTLAYQGVPLPLKVAKALPSSD